MEPGLRLAFHGARCSRVESRSAHLRDLSVQVNPGACQRQWPRHQFFCSSSLSDLFSQKFHSLILLFRSTCQIRSSLGCSEMESRSSCAPSSFPRRRFLSALDGTFQQCPQQHSKLVENMDGSSPGAVTGRCEAECGFAFMQSRWEPELCNAFGAGRAVMWAPSLDSKACAGSSA